MACCSSFRGHLSASRSRPDFTHLNLMRIQLSPCTRAPLCTSVPFPLASRAQFARNARCTRGTLLPCTCFLFAPHRLRPQTKECAFQARAAAEAAALRSRQERLERETGQRLFVGRSLADTLREAIR